MTLKGSSGSLRGFVKVFCGFKGDCEGVLGVLNRFRGFFSQV